MRGDSGRTLSPWLATAETPARPPLPADARADVCVVGAGMAGLSARLYGRVLNGPAVRDLPPIGEAERARRAS